MWLLPASSLLANLAARVFYRFSCVGPRPPRRGPVLLLANHPNSLADAVLVSAVARRPVRYLAKAPLFSDPQIGWLVRAAGAIPVHRRSDDPELSVLNVHTFHSVFEALAEGSAVGIFPEGISHSEPALARLKTGAARMALGFASRHGRTFPLVPIGLVLRDKATFRSEAAAFLGQPVPWDDLAQSGEDDREAVQTLTGRIDEALRRVTVNLDRWEDEPLVRSVEEIWRAEITGEGDATDQLARVQATAEFLAELRRRGDESWIDLARSIDRHRRRLKRLRLTPTSLRSRTDPATALRWTLRRLHILGPLALVVAVVGALAYWPPYRLTGTLARLAPPEEALQSTYKLLIGTVLYPLWTVLLAVAAWLWQGIWPAVLVLVGVPLTGVTGLWVRERWQGAWRDSRRFFTMRARTALVDALRARQKKLARELERLYESRKEVGSREKPGRGNSS